MIRNNSYNCLSEEARILKLEVFTVNVFCNILGGHVERKGATAPANKISAVQLLLRFYSSGA